MTSLELIEISKYFRSGGMQTLGLRDVTLSVPGGSRCVLLGCSGAGKSTLLRIIAGLETADLGVIRMDGIDASKVKPADRGISLLPQDTALYPQLTVEQNIFTSGKKLRLSKKDLSLEVLKMLEQFSITNLRDKLPSEISGGEMQRVALARALISRPRILLLDEPLSHLDGHTKEAAIELLDMVHHEFQPTTLIVTHDPLDAMRLSDYMAILHRGELLDSGHPNQLYSKPTSRIGGSLLSPFGMNWLDLSLLKLTEVKSDGNNRFIGFRPEDATLEPVVKTSKQNSVKAACHMDQECYFFQVEVSGIQTLGFARLAICRFLNEQMRILCSRESKEVFGNQAVCRVPISRCCTVKS